MRCVLNSKVNVKSANASRVNRSSIGFTLVEILIVAALFLIVSSLLAQAGWKAYESSSLAVSANNLRQLSAGTAQYLPENQHRFWRYREEQDGGTVWWFGFEDYASRGRGEGKRSFDPDLSPLAGYIPSAMRPDPSLALQGGAFKPKYASGYIGLGYNSVLGGGVFGRDERKTYWELSNPSRVVVFATSAQVNTFQRPASPSKPMIEEFYLINRSYRTVHFRHGDQAMVGFADGSCGFLPMEPGSRDMRFKKGLIGRLEKKYLE